MKVHGPIIEKIQYISPDGQAYNIHTPPKRSILEMDGWGMSPKNLFTTSGPFQHGETVIGIRLAPRTIRMLVRHNGCSRSDFWGVRDTILDLIRPNRVSLVNPSPGRLRYQYLRNGVRQVRDLDVYLNRGYTFESKRGQWDEFSVQEEVEFIAHNPVIYDPTLITVNVTAFVEGLVLPLTFPFVLGAYGALQNITYTGSFESYPTLEVTGPADCFTIINTTTDTRISLDYTISAGEIVTFDLGYDIKSVTNNFGSNLLGYLTSNTDLGGFRLETAPTAPVGVNALQIYLEGPTAATAVAVKYYRNYIGI